MTRDLMDEQQRGRVTKDERKRAEAARVPSTVRAHKGPMRFNADTRQWEHVEQPKVEAVARAKPVSFRNAVVIASSVGVCMFCSDPHATMKFTNDDSVRICAKCVR